MISPDQALHEEVGSPYHSYPPAEDCFGDSGEARLNKRHNLPNASIRARNRELAIARTYRDYLRLWRHLNGDVASQ